MQSSEGHKRMPTRCPERRRGGQEKQKSRLDKCYVKCASGSVDVHGNGRGVTTISMS